MKDQKTTSENNFAQEFKPLKPVTFQTPRGTRDILPEEQKYWQFVKTKAEQIAAVFGFKRIDVPTFESAVLFNRGIGSQTDIVAKELFYLSSKDDSKDGGDQLALRPEFTAGIARAYIEHGMHTLPQPLKFFSIGQIYRHEKPQKGRFRDPYQFNLEIIADGSPKADAWIILASWQYFVELGLNNVEIQINSLGDPSFQKSYQQKLREYYLPLADKLCPTCQVRLEKNVLRLLDCKEPNCVQLKEEAPQTLDHLDEASKEHFMGVLSLLDSFGITYSLNPFIVRGLDYYTHTAFEIMIGASQQDEAKKEAGAKHQLAIGGGGRYNGLIEQLGGSPTPAVGVALGLDRIIEEMKKQKVQVAHEAHTEIFIAGIGPKAMTRAKEVILDLLRGGIAAEFSPDKNSISSQLKIADKLGVNYTVIIGEKEVKENTCIIRDMKSGIQEDAKLDELVSIFTERLGK